MGKEGKLSAGSSGSICPLSHARLRPRGCQDGHTGPPPRSPRARSHTWGARPATATASWTAMSRQGVAGRSRWPISWRTSSRASEEARARLLAAPQAGAGQRGSRLRAGTAATGRTALPSSHVDGRGHPFQIPLGAQLPAPRAACYDAVPAQHPERAKGDGRGKAVRSPAASKGGLGRGKGCGIMFCGGENRPLSPRSGTHVGVAGG